MESYTGTRFLVEKEEALLDAAHVQQEPSGIKPLMKEKAELFLALIEKVNEPSRSYINQYSWLFGRH